MVGAGAWFVEVCCLGLKVAQTWSSGGAMAMTQAKPLTLRVAMDAHELCTRLTLSQYQVK